MNRLVRCALTFVLSDVGCGAEPAAPQPARLDAGPGGQDAGSAASPLPAPDTTAAPAVDAGLFSAPNTLIGEEALFLSNVSLQSLDRELDHQRFAAVIVGLRTVEVLEESAGELRAQAVAMFDPPEIRSRRAPLFAWAVDVDCDGATDLAFAGLEDAYVLRATASGALGEREPWDRYLPGAPALHPFDQRAVFERASVILPYEASKKRLRAFVRPAGICNWLTTNELAQPVAPIAGEFVVGFPAGDGLQLLVQNRDTIADRLRLTVSADAVGLSAEGVATPMPESPYLRAFDSITGPTPLSARAECATTFLGVGSVASHSELSLAVKTKLTSLQVNSLTSSHYLWRDVPETSGLVAYGAAVRASESDELIGVVRALDGQQHEFVLLQRAGCSPPHVLARVPIEFDWRTPPAPLFGMGRPGSDARPGYVPRRDYPARLVSKLTSDALGPRLLFAHYDGYDARVVEARQADGTWSLTFLKTTLHEERNDLSFPFTESDVRAERERARSDAAVAAR